MHNRRDDGCHYFSTCETLTYVPFCDDFGPMNLFSIIAFTEILEGKLMDYPDAKIVYCAENDSRSLTNAAFLLGSYMILKIGLAPEDVWSTFSMIETSFSGYRDATFLEPDFELSLLDCWRSLARAKHLQWINSYDLDEYCHYDNPLEGDLHTVVPGKLIAFQGPKQLPNKTLYYDDNGHRLFAPGFYAEIFQEMGVETVIRLNEAIYDTKEFTDHGITVASLEFEDCTAPPPEIVVRFMDIVKQSEGMVAVHCKAGLGRTGTLIAIYLMSVFGFTAKEAIGWVRIIRPGSIIGEQQHFLCMIERMRAIALEESNDVQTGSHAESEPPSAQDEVAAAASRACEALEMELPPQERERRAKLRAEQLASGLDSDIRNFRRAHSVAMWLAAPTLPMALPELNSNP